MRRGAHWQGVENKRTRDLTEDELTTLRTEVDNYQIEGDLVRASMACFLLLSPRNPHTHAARHPCIHASIRRKHTRRRALAVRRFLFLVCRPRKLDVDSKHGCQGRGSQHQITFMGVDSTTDWLDLTWCWFQRRFNLLSIKRLKEIQCYRGKRHIQGLPMRGQHTKNNARTRKGKRVAIAGKKKVAKK